MNMRVKICGLRESENVKSVSALKPDLMGFIFYPKSSRFVKESSLEEVLESISPPVSTVAVFVNESVQTVLQTCRKYGFLYAQLHGDETAEDCKMITEGGVAVIKAIPVLENIDFNALKAYESHVDLFLFDTRTAGFGGSGKQFDWNLLSSYPLNTPYFLSGGIGENDIESIMEATLPGLVGIDTNSRLEIEPGLKDVQVTSQFIDQIRNR